ncbi:nitroreductase family protein [Murinocardiopsis flavida]|nr:SagB family peptide dehydrogenase [Murinocardiopsis flavida]
MSTVDDYLRALEHRAREPLGPPGFTPDWRDQPLRHKVYPGIGALPFPHADPHPESHTDRDTGPRTESRTGPHADPDADPNAAAPGAARAPAADFGAAVFGPPPPPGAALPPHGLAAMLYHSHGLLDRRLRVTPNAAAEGMARYDAAVWSRGTASGGGLYPCEVYWTPGPGGPMLPGVYHYSAPRAAFHRLLAGDVTDRVRAALPDADAGADAAGFLLVTVKFWKNTYKYADFGYHVVTMDVGCLLETWRLWLRAHGAESAPSLWFDEEALNRLLGLATREESVMAVLPLGSGDAAGTPLGGRPPNGAARPAGPRPPAPAVAAAEHERSRTVTRFDTVERVHEATLAGARVPPGPEAYAAAAARTAGPAGDGGGSVALPPVQRDRLGAALPGLLRTRRSAFGTFAAAPPVPAAALGTVLACAARARGAAEAAPDGAAGPGLVRLAVLAQHVSDVAPGVYDYADRADLASSADRAGRTDHALHPAAPARGVQDLYTLDNYDLDRAAAVIAVVARPRAAAAALGPRGYRLVNAEAGMAAQNCYLAAAALGLGCGAALAFDPLGLADRFGLGPDESPLLLLMVGNERRDRADVASGLR